MWALRPWSLQSLAIPSLNDAPTSAPVAHAGGTNNADTATTTLELPSPVTPVAKGAASIAAFDDPTTTAEARASQLEAEALALRAARAQLKAGQLTSARF
jgi:hypothetical protein